MSNIVSYFLINFSNSYESCMISLLFACSVGCEETIWWAYSLRICVNLQACGTCKISRPLYPSLVLGCYPIFYTSDDTEHNFWLLALLLLILVSVFSDVRNNSLTGNIPEGIGNCTAFQVLYVARINIIYKLLKTKWEYVIIWIFFPSKC